MLLDPSAKFKEVPPESLISESNCSRLRPAIENIKLVYQGVNGTLYTECIMVVCFHDTIIISFS